MELKDPVMQLKLSIGCITVAMKTEMTTMIFSKSTTFIKILKPINKAYHETII